MHASFAPESRQHIRHTLLPVHLMRAFAGGLCGLLSRHSFHSHPLHWSGCACVRVRLCARLRACACAARRHGGQAGEFTCFSPSTHLLLPGRHLELLLASLSTCRLRCLLCFVSRRESHLLHFQPLQVQIPCLPKSQTWWMSEVESSSKTICAS